MTGERLGARLVVLALALFVYLTAEMFPVGALSEVASGLDVRESTAGLLLTSYAVVAGVAAIPVVRLTRRLDRRTVLTSALVLLTGSQVALALAPTFEVAFVARGAAALAHGYVWAVVPVVAGRLAPTGSTGRATAMVFLGSTAGLIIGTPLSAALSQTVGWRAASGVLALAAAGTAVALRTALPALPAPVETRHDRAAGTWGAVAVVCTVTAVAATAHYVSYTFLAPLMRVVGIDGTAYAALLLGYGLAGLVGVWVVGRVLDRWTRATAVGLFGLLAASLAVLAGMLALDAPTSVLVAVPVVVVVLVWAAAFSAAPAVLQHAVITVAPQQAATASAVYVVAFQIGIAGGSAAGAVALGVVDTASLPLVSTALAAAALVVVVVRGVVPRQPSGA